MRFVALVTMLVACLVYGFMPARAATPAQTPQAVTSLAHSGHSMGRNAAEDPCPHRGGPAHSPFCAACLAIVPAGETVREGHPPFSWPAPAAGRALAAVAPAPAEPPPRA